MTLHSYLKCHAVARIFFIWRDILATLYARTYSSGARRWCVSDMINNASVKKKWDALLFWLRWSELDKETLAIARISVSEATIPLRPIPSTSWCFMGIFDQLRKHLPLRRKMMGVSIDQLLFRVQNAAADAT